MALFGHTSIEQYFLEGVREYWEENPGAAGIIHRSVAELEADAGSIGGIVSYIPYEKTLEALRPLGCPLVNTSNRFLAAKLPSVVIDDEEVGRLAGRHLLERGYRCVHFVSHPKADFSREREAGLREVCEAEGVPVEVSPFPGLTEHLEPTEFIESLFALGEHFLKGDVSRRAILFFADTAAYSFLAAATPRFGIRLMQLAFMGVDAMEPPDAAVLRLTSVKPDFRRVGFEAAALLARLLQGESAPAGPVRISDLRVIEGDTTPRVEEP